MDFQEEVITFGSIDLPQMDTAKNESLHFFSNMDEGYWAVLMDHLHYDGASISKSLPIPDKKFAPVHLAYIDSVNASIQISELEFD